jgi:predicted tellurium resistance membrane protein TerC
MIGIEIWKTGTGLMDAYLNAESLAALLTLTSLEMVLGIDNVIFIAILCGKLPEAQRDKARTLGLMLAVVSRILLVLAIGWVMTLTKELFVMLGHRVTGKDLILIFGGLFLLFKGTREIHHKMQDAGSSDDKQILMIDVVFSLDSVITAVGMTEGLKHPIPIMVTAIILSVMGMLAFSKAIVVFIERNPTIKILALSFLMLIGLLLMAEGFGHHIPKGYVYFAMCFSFIVEMLQLWTLKPPKPPAPETQY